MSLKSTVRSRVHIFLATAQNNDFERTQDETNSIKLIMHRKHSGFILCLLYNVIIGYFNFFVHSLSKYGTNNNTKSPEKAC